MTRGVVGAAVFGAWLFVAGCDDKKTSLAPAASSLAPAVAAPSAMTRTFVIDNGSKATIEMEAPKEKIKATATGGAGSIEIDLTNLASSRGEVKMDLTTLTTSTFSGKADSERENKAQTTHARTWLEVADGEEGKLDDKLKETNRYAVYAIRSVENASANDVTKVAKANDGADEVRTVTLTTKGEILVHGHKAPREADVELAFRYDAGATADKPKALVVKTKKPLRIVLAEHDVKPRDKVGKIAKESFHLLGTKVAENADVSLDLRARPK